MSTDILIVTLALLITDEGKLRCFDYDGKHSHEYNTNGKIEGVKIANDIAYYVISARDTNRYTSSSYLFAFY